MVHTLEYMRHELVFCWPQRLLALFTFVLVPDGTEGAL